MSQVPGGEVRSLMHAPAITAHRDDTVSDVAKLMIEHNIGSVVVVDDTGKFCGLVTEQMFMPTEDLIPFMRGTATRLMGAAVGSDHSTGYYEAIERVRSKSVEEVMKSDPPFVRADATIDVVIELIATTGENHITVVLDGIPIGMIARHDLLRMFIASESNPD